MYTPSTRKRRNQREKEKERRKRASPSQEEAGQSGLINGFIHSFLDALMSVLYQIQGIMNSWTLDISPPHTLLHDLSTLINPFQSSINSIHSFPSNLPSTMKSSLDPTLPRRNVCGISREKDRNLGRWTLDSQSLPFHHRTT